MSPPLRLTLSALAFVVGCSSSSSSSDAGTKAPGEAGSDAGSGGGPTCSEVCAKLEKSCPAAAPSSCASTCEAQHLTSSELTCVANASNCAAIETCETGMTTKVPDSGATHDAGALSGDPCAAQDDGTIQVTCDCGGATITDCAEPSDECSVCSGAGTCSDCHHGGS